MDSHRIATGNTQLQPHANTTQMGYNMVPEGVSFQQPHPQSGVPVQLANVQRMEQGADMYAQCAASPQRVYQELDGRQRFYEGELQRQRDMLQSYYEDQLQQKAAAIQKDFQAQLQQQLTKQQNYDRQQYNEQLTNQKASFQDCLGQQSTGLQNHYEQQLSDLQQQHAQQVAQLQQQLNGKDFTLHERTTEQYKIHVLNLQQRLEDQKFSLDKAQKGNLIALQRKLHEKDSVIYQYSRLISRNKEIIGCTPNEDQLIDQARTSEQERAEKDAEKDAEIARLKTERVDATNARCKHTVVGDLKIQLEFERHEVKSLKSIVGLRDKQLLTLEKEKEAVKKQLQKKELQTKLKREEELDSQVLDRFASSRRISPDSNIGTASPDTAITTPDTENAKYEKKEEEQQGSKRHWEGEYVESEKWARLFQE
ncbi:hypothetical protein N431DRAFT_458662 [Stipitochalara longipes BDJ]|nr:hypothetical protein N431DRAFT_458662 [Stipitochalara longipes BDJ]